MFLDDNFKENFTAPLPWERTLKQKNVTNILRCSKCIEKVLENETTGEVPC